MCVFNLSSVSFKQRIHSASVIIRKLEDFSFFGRYFQILIWRFNSHMKKDALHIKQAILYNLFSFFFFPLSNGNECQNRHFIIDTVSKVPFLVSHCFGKVKYLQKLINMNTSHHMNTQTSEIIPLCKKQTKKQAKDIVTREKSKTTITWNYY